MFNTHVRKSISLAQYRGGRHGPVGFHAFSLSYTQRQDVSPTLNRNAGEPKVYGNIDVVGKLHNDLHIMDLMGELQNNTALI